MFILFSVFITTKLELDFSSDWEKRFLDLLIVDENPCGSVASEGISTRSFFIVFDRTLAGL